MDIITAYRDFILGLIELPTRVHVLKRMINKGEGAEAEYGFYSTKLGIGPVIDVDVRIDDVYSRSAKIIVKFDKYEKEYIYYISRHFSPETQLEKFDQKLSDVINDTLIKDERWELLDELEKKEKQRFFGRFKGGTFKIIQSE